MIRLLNVEDQPDRRGEPCLINHLPIGRDMLRPLIAVQFGRRLAQACRGDRRSSNVGRKLPDMPIPAREANAE